ncbi:MAG: hypothetical protein WCQ99_00375 [Pseudomonadota bacterium]
MTEEKTATEYFFLKWEKKKLSEYNEPLRKGKKRGALIGLVYEKQQYALRLMLERYKSPSVASTYLKKSSGLIAKWKTERYFKQSTSLIEIEFVEYTAEFLIKNTINSRETGQIIAEFCEYKRNVQKDIIVLLEQARDDLKNKSDEGIQNLEDIKTRIFLELICWLLYSIYMHIKDEASEGIKNERGTGLFKYLLKVMLEQIQEIKLNKDNEDIIAIYNKVYVSFLSIL